MIKRTLILGEYNTADHLWTLSSLALSKPARKENFVEVPASDMVLELSTALTDGEPRYNTRTLTATLETSEGDRLTRQQRIGELINQLDGSQLHITHPDHPDRYLVGWVSIQELYNDMAHAAVQIDAVCEPWLYSDELTTYTLQADVDEKGSTIINSGRLSVVPEIEILTDPVNMRFLTNDASWSLSPGTYKLPDLYLTPGSHRVRYIGAGQIVIRFREAVLA